MHEEAWTERSGTTGQIDPASRSLPMDEPNDERLDRRLQRAVQDAQRPATEICPSPCAGSAFSSIPELPSAGGCSSTSIELAKPVRSSTFSASRRPFPPSSACRTQLRRLFGVHRPRSPATRADRRLVRSRTRHPSSKTIRTARSRKPPGRTAVTLNECTRTSQEVKSHGNRRRPTSALSNELQRLPSCTFNHIRAPL